MRAIFNFVTAFLNPFSFHKELFAFLSICHIYVASSVQFNPGCIFRTKVITFNLKAERSKGNLFWAGCRRGWREHVPDSVLAETHPFVFSRRAALTTRTWAQLYEQSTVLASRVHLGWLWVAWSGIDPESWVRPLPPPSQTFSFRTLGVLWATYLRICTMKPPCWVGTEFSYFGGNSCTLGMVFVL